MTSKSNRPMLVLFLFVTLVFVLLAARSERNDTHINNNQDRIEKAQQLGCQRTAVVVETLNALQAGVLAAERAWLKADAADPALTAIHQARIKVYEAGIQPAPAHC